MPKKPLKSWTYKQLVSLIDPKTESVAFSDSDKDKDQKYACIVDNENDRMKALFVKGNNGRYVRMELEKMLEFIATKLEPHFNIKDFLKEFIALRTPPDQVASLFERLHNPKASVKHHKDCYTLRIGGDRGYPEELVLCQ